MAAGRLFLRFWPKTKSWGWLAGTLVWVALLTGGFGLPTLAQAQLVSGVSIQNLSDNDFVNSGLFVDEEEFRSGVEIVQNAIDPDGSTVVVGRLSTIYGLGALGAIFDPQVDVMIDTGFSLSFNITRPLGMPWLVEVETWRAGALTMQNCSQASVAMEITMGAAAYSGTALTTGSLDLAGESHTFDCGNVDEDSPFSGMATATIAGTGTGAAQAISLEFAAQQTVTATLPILEATIRQGRDVETITLVGQVYPGPGARDISDDGHFVKIRACDDPDGDGLCTDNCPFVYNPDQADVNMNLQGDACDCGDINSDGMVDQNDPNHLQLHLADPLSFTANQNECPVYGVERPCDLITWVVLKRAIAPYNLPPHISPLCENAQ